MPRIIVIDDTQAIHDDFRKILVPASASGALQGAKAALFGDAAPEQPSAGVAGPFELDSALQGEEGWHKVRAAIAEGRPYSVAFVDMRMPPGWDGLCTIQRLWEADADVQVVICTAYSDHSWQAIRQTLGLTDRLLILKKPFDPVEVFQLATALSEKWALKRAAGLKLEELESIVRERTNALEHAAHYDRLTGLPNRAQFSDQLAGVLERSRANPADGFAVFFLDFDRFKIVNDSLGHAAGDQLLAEIAARLKASLSEGPCAGLCSGALAARLGGDEFVILAPGLTDARDATKYAGHVLDALSQPYKLQGYNLVATASIGVTTSAIGYENADAILRDADTAMYHAKAAGRARAVVFDQRMHQHALDRLRLENEMRGVVDRGELTVHYQPVVCLNSGQLRGFEALVRWNHPVRGLVSPAQFIPYAEESGAIVPIGLWVLRQACTQLAQWRRSGPAAGQVHIAVNVSARQLASPGFIDDVRTVITETGIDPASLILELTESAVLRDPDAANAVMQGLRSLGVQLYMDDFGTGYTSLSYLHKLPLTGLKMDRSFMQCVGERRDYAAIVHAIVTLARNLNLKVVAEGVERPDQMAMLQAIECDLGQGYLFGRPAEAAQAASFIGRPRIALAA